MVTRGNVAIYCYNALTAKVWDIAESTGSELTSKESRENTILAKYFSDFTNDNGEMKLVEDVTVTATPISDKELGVNQIVITGAYHDEEVETAGGSKKTVKVASAIYGEKSQTIAKFLGLKSTVKNKEEKTYGRAQLRSTSSDCLRQPPVSSSNSVVAKRVMANHSATL